MFKLYSFQGRSNKNEVVRHFSHEDKYYGLQEIVVLHMWLDYACITCLSDFGVCLPGNIMLEILNRNLPGQSYQLFLLYILLNILCTE